MKVFLSWSGDVSHKVALALRDWLPAVLQYVEPYVSSEDIDKGARWSSDIAKELEESSYGILCVTESNIDAPWLTFEAGALSKSLDKSRVSPLLFGVKRSEVQGPILQFQSTVISQDDILKLVGSINGAATESESLDEERLKRVFGVWWPQLDAKFNEIPSQSASGEATDTRTDDRALDPEILEEILELTRTNQRMLNDPEALLPRGYIEHVLRGLSPSDLGPAGTATLDVEAWDYLCSKFRALQTALQEVFVKERPTVNQGEKVELDDLLDSLEGVIRHIDIKAREAGGRGYRRSRKK